MKRSRTIKDAPARDDRRPAVASAPDRGLGAALLDAARKPPPKMKSGCGAASYWTPERYHFILKLRQTGEERLRMCGETRISDVVALEAGIRIHNQQTYSPEPEGEIKSKARSYASRLGDARQVVGQNVPKARN